MDHVRSDRESHCLPDRHLRPRIPPCLLPALVPKPFQKLDHAPYISPITPEPKTDADDTQLPPNERLEILERRTVAQAIHDVFNPEECRGPSGIAHAACAQRDVVHRGDVFNKGVWEHVAGRLLNRWGLHERASRTGRKLTHGEDDERDGGPGFRLFADRL